jgi:hypothetical protein
MRKTPAGKFTLALYAGAAPVAQQAEPLGGKWEGAEEWMPLAWELCANECGEDACTELVWEGGPIPEPWGERWLKYEDEAKRLIALVRKCTAAAHPQQPAADHFPDAGNKVAHPQQPARVPLTDAQIDALPWGPHEGNPITFAEGLREFARAIEAAHGIVPAPTTDQSHPQR